MSRPPFEVVLDECIEDVQSGRRTPAECLARWPEHADALAPLLQTALATRALAIPVNASDAARRAEFMRAIRNTPQQSRGGPSAWFAGALRALGRQGLLVAPATVAVALVVVFGRSVPSAEASTLTVFAGAVERQRGDAWTVLRDGEQLGSGVRLRTDEVGRALLTFRDGSTVALDPRTEMSIEVARLDGPREIVLWQQSGRLWHQVAPDQREGASFTVRTPSATVVARGTVFETAITDGETAVNTAEGVVEVVAGSQRVEVASGQSASAARDSVRAPVAAPSAAVTAALTVDAPFVASVIGQDGRATGAFPNGVVYQQIPGVLTTDPWAGAQRIEFTEVRPGAYTLLLRRTGPGDGTLTLSAQGAEQLVTLDASGDLMTLRLEITPSGGKLRLEAASTPGTRATAEGSRGEAKGDDAERGPERVIVTERARERAAEQLQKRLASPSVTATPRPLIVPTAERDEREGRERDRERDDENRRREDARPPDPTRTAVPAIVPALTPERTSTPRPGASPTRAPTLFPIPLPTRILEREDDRDRSRDDRSGSNSGSGR